MTRPYLRDSIWLGLALGFPILIVGGLLANRFPSGRVRAVVLVCTIGIVLVYDSYSRIDLQGKLDANYNLYGWQRDMLFRYRYGENQRHYIDALSGWAGGFNFSAHETLLVTRQIEDFDRIQRTLEYVLWNVPLETLRIGTVVTGGRVTHAFPGLYFGKVTPELEGTTLYDMSQIQPSHRTLPRRGAVTRMMETDKKIPRRLVGGGGPGLVALLGRRDLSIWLFLPNGVCSAEATKYFGAPGDAKLWARHQGGGKTLHVGYPLRGYATIPASCFKASGFLVVREW